MNAAIHRRPLISGRGILVATATLIVGAFLIAGLPRIALLKRDVSQHFVLYLEGIKPAGKLVVLTATERYVASKEFTAQILAVLHLNARVEISALADTSYFVDLQDTARWSAVWERRGRRLIILAPPPDVLLPAVHTDSIEVHTEGQNLLTNAVFQLKKEAETMKSELSTDLELRARAGLSNPELQDRIRSSIADLARSFCSSVLRIEPTSVSVDFRDR